MEVKLLLIVNIGLLMMGIEKMEETGFSRGAFWGFEGIFKGLKKIASFF